MTNAMLSSLSGIAVVIVAPIMRDRAFQNASSRACVIYPWMDALYSGEAWTVLEHDTLVK